jgi:hypothetical protein
VGGDWFDRNGTVNGSTPFATATIKDSDSVGTGKYIDLDITGLVKGIRDGDYPNTGIMIKAKTESGDYLQFSSLVGGNKPKISYLEGEETTSEPEESEEPETPSETDLSGYTIVEGPGSDALATIQAAINKATAGKGIYLKGPATYNLGTGHVVLKSGISIGGDKSTVIYGSSTTGGVVRGSTSDGWFYGSGVSGLKLFGFTMQSGAVLRDGGLGETRNCILLRNCHDVEIFDISCLKYMYNDFVKCHTGYNIVIHDNVVQSGHDGIEFLNNSHDCEAYNNSVEIRINCGMRIDNGKNIRLHHNNFTGQSGTGWCVFEIEDTVTDCEIDHNIAHDWTGSSGSAFTQNVHATVKNLNVHDNVMWKSGTPGIGTLKDNIINPVDQEIANWQKKGYGIQG